MAGGGTTLIEVELPAVALDPLVLDSSTVTRLRLFNRNPEPGEVEVPIASSIVLDVANTLGGGTVETSLTKIYVRGVLAYDSGSFTAGFSGSVDGISDGWRWTIAVGTPFTSQELVVVRVVAQSTTPVETLDETYSFTIVDLTAPQAISAQAIAHKVVRITFDEDMRLTSAADATSALNPANYTFVPVTKPAVTPIVLSVVQVTTRTMELELDLEMTQGATYTLTVSNATDVHGNVVAP